MWRDEDIPLDFRPNNSVGREKERKEKGREEESRERGSTFSLDFSTIELSVSGEVGGKVLSLDKSCKQRLETESFDKRREVGLLLLWLFSTLRAVWLCLAPREMFGCI